MRQKQKFQWDRLSVGTCYYPEHWDRSLWQEDLRRMKANGVGTVRVAEFAWTIFEPEEGVFSFELFDAFLDVAQEEQVSVIFCTPTSIPPVWMSEKYPEILNATKDGVLYRHGMRRHFNYNSKVLRMLASEAIEAIAAHYAKRPCIVGWQIDNELNCEINEYYSASDNLAFRDHLKKKYQTLDALNDAWGTVFWNQTYTNWDQVYIPRTTINGHTNPHQLLDYKFFVSESTISFCKMQSDILRKYVKPGDFITTNSVFGNVDNHKMSDTCLDVHMYDSYPAFAFALGTDPKHSTDLNDRKWSMNLSGVRSICPHFGVMEQQSGPGGWNIGHQMPAAKPGQIMLWAMQSVAHGADYISFFRWRTCTKGTEMYWHGILDYDNRDNRRLGEVKEVSRRLERIRETAGAAYEARAALVKDYENTFDAQVDAWHGEIANASEAAIYQAAQLTHTPMDIFYLRDDTDLSEIKKYQVLFCPHEEILSSEKAALLAQYAQSGGTLILGARTGQKDTRGHCVMQPMPGLLAQAAQTEVEEFTFIGPADEPVSMDWDGKRLPTGCFNDLLTVTGPDAKVLAVYKDTYYDGKPALVETKLGEGKILHFGGVFTRESTKAFLSYAGVLAPHSSLIDLPEDCEIAVKSKDGHQYLFVLNYSGAEQAVELKEAVTDLDTGEKFTGKKMLPAYGTSVYRVE